VRANDNIKFLLIAPLLIGLLAPWSPAAAAEPAGPQPDASELLSRFADRMRGQVSELKSIRQLMTVSTRMGAQSITMDQRVEMVFPDRVRRTMLVAGEEQAFVFNAGKGFLASGELTLPLSESRLSEAVKQLGRDLLLLAASVGSPDLQATLGGADEQDGTPCRTVAVSLGNIASRLCLDDEGKALRQSFESRHPMTHVPGTIEILFSDYRDAAGVFYPFRQVVTFNGEEMVTVTVQSLQVNPELPDSLFATSSAE